MHVYHSHCLNEPYGIEMFPGGEKVCHRAREAEVGNPPPDCRVVQCKVHSHVYYYMAACQ